ncbi:MAG: CDP-diacylglycerol--glycerol-3-phosphate 3-phosphatidyltransferase [Chlamydiales bacterium 38-26]|nr:CDP-alcohol phosphatidyltransferase family protein [Chlamydiales bacterium]OJV10825.1 MAG: CDP-diacylglycerol--glycerol-3-phosphate 3-phosphatidyltransferase [Chlamydiales bacterium 38-26]
MLFNLPNLISFSRIPLALLFLYENPLYRLIAVCLAMLSDGLDGYLARRQKITTKVGTLLDPFADKFFVIFVVCILIHEEKLQIWQAITLGCRDLSVLVFGIHLILNKRLSTYQFRAILCGKITTFLQFFVLLALTLNLSIPDPLFITFILLGLLSLVELALPKRSGVA